jgi:hypothetical protein
MPPTPLTYHRLPTPLWLQITSFLKPHKPAATAAPTRDWLRAHAYALCLWRRLDTAWNAWVRDLVRHNSVPTTQAPPHPLWPLACHPTPPPPTAPRCVACGTHAAPLVVLTLRWHVVVYGFGTGVHTGIDRTRDTCLCPACTRRCTLSSKQALRTLLRAAVGEYTPSPTRGPFEAPEPLPWVATEGTTQATVVLFDDHCRYLRADVDAMAARPGWGSHSIERIDFTSHRVALEWRTGWRVARGAAAAGVGWYRPVREESSALRPALLH